MYYLCCILQHVIDCLNDISFSKHHSIIKWHKFIFHVDSQSRHQLYPILKKTVEKSLRYIAPVGKQLAIQAFSQDLEHLRVLITHIGTCKYKRYDFSPIIACQVQFESMTPSHGSLSVCSYSLEYFVRISSEIMTNRYHIMSKVGCIELRRQRLKLTM